MRLAEALSERAALKQRLSALRERAGQAAVVQDGDEPIMDAAELLTEIDQVALQLEELSRRINETNLSAEVEPHLSVTAAIARRDRLAWQRNTRMELVERATRRHDRWMRTEIRYVPTVDVAALLAEADRLAAERRRLDARIQERNWQVDLVGSEPA